MSWQDKRISHLIAGVGVTLVGDRYSAWSSQVATGGASQGMDANRPTRSTTKVLGREGAVFARASSNWMQLADVGAALSGATPGHAFGLLLTLNGVGVDQYLIGAGSSDDEFRSLRINGANQYFYAARYSGNPNQSASFGPGSYFVATKTYALIYSMSGTSAQAIARPLDGSGDASGTGTVTLAGGPTLEVGVLGGRYINGSPERHADITLHEAMVFDDALSGDVANEAGGGEVWDLMPYLTSPLSAGRATYYHRLLAGAA
ncbi:MAG: hypothetical protein AAGC44_05285 [Planctomycetota bacterium]